MHFCRESGLEADDEGAHLADDAVQQFGVWEVDGLGLAVAFRGTACLDDVVIDANIAPVPLGNPPGKHPAVPTRELCYRAERCLLASLTGSSVDMFVCQALSLPSPHSPCSMPNQAAEFLLVLTYLRGTSMKGHSGSAGRRPLHVHRGFHAGAVRHLDEIVAAVRARDAAAGCRLPVWVAGHSLGGGCAPVC